MEIIQVETNFHIPKLKPNNSHFEQKYSFLYFDICTIKSGLTCKRTLLVYRNTNK